MSKNLIQGSFISSILCAVLFAVASQLTATAQEPKRPDKVKSTHTQRGSFLEFEMGDYLHAEFRKSNGKRVSFFMGENESLRYFLAAHRGKRIYLTYQVVETFIPESGGVETIQRLVAATSGNETDTQWWRRIRRTGNLARLRARHDELVERATKK